MKEGRSKRIMITRFDLPNRTKSNQTELNKNSDIYTNKAVRVGDNATGNTTQETPSSEYVAIKKKPTHKNKRQDGIRRGIAKRREKKSGSLNKRGARGPFDFCADRAAER